MPAWAVLALSLAIAAMPATAQQRAEGEFQPSVGQAGKDVIWVPTPPELIEKLFQMAALTASDFVIDLGSGDGRIAIMAAKKYGARAMGIEYNPDMVALSNRAAQREGVADKVKFVKADIFESDFSQATIITMYLLPDLNLKLRPKILEMKPGTRVASHQFTMGEWQPDESANIDNRQALFWIVPAKVGGAWNVRLNGGAASELNLKQSFQMIEGTLKVGANTLALLDAKLRGDQISFKVTQGGTSREYTGRVSGNGIEGSARSGSAEARWQATRR
jgi:SAM-dependent methyltransferase